MTMEVVRVFNNELSSLYEAKPPISKAKMTQITKSAIKGIKFYKHIVQSVEKFVQKCRPEYKVPGLYVVDSIVRQSRHQFGADKDVFAPRFTKNITATFQNLFKCAEEDRPKIVRVLNLWQKNAVFPSDVIQPLMDMANPNSSGEWPSFDTQPIGSSESPVRKNLPQTNANESNTAQNSKHKSMELSSWKGWPQANDEPAVPDTQCYMEMSTRNLEKFTKGDNSNMSIPDEAPQVKTQQQKTADVKLSEEPTVKFNKKLLDFDYGDEEDEEEMKVEDGQLSNQPNALALSMAQNLLSNPELLRQLQQMQQTIQQNEALKSELAMQSQDSNSMHKNHDDGFSPNAHESPVPPPVQAIPFPDQQSVMQFQYDNNAIPFPPPQQQLPPLPLVDPIHPAEPVYQQSMLTPDQLILQTGQIDEDDRVIYSMPGEPPLPPQDLDERAIVVPLEDIIRKDRSRSDSRSRTRSSRHRNRSKSPRRRKSRSRSRSRSRRNRSRSRDRERERMREKDNREREKEREKEHERRKRGIPPIKKNCMSVCSTTLWLGHVPKTLSKVDISSTFEDFGTVLSINMIPPRGCAYVVMDRRQDGHRALQKLKNLKLQGSTIKMAWAPGKGVKGKEFKEYWEVDLGVSYIPHEKIPNADTLDLLEEGGFIDEESMPQHLRELREAKEKEKAKLLAQSTKKQENDLSEKGLSAEAIAHHAAVLGTHMMPNSSLGMPMVLPQLMQPQYGMPMPGLMPHQAMMMSVPMGVPPPNPMMMVQPPSQSLMGGQPLPGTVPQVPHLTMPHPPVQPISGTVTTAADSPAVTSTVSTSAAGDATPTDEDGTSVSSPSATNAVQTLPTMVSATSMPQDTVTMTQFNSALGPHSVTRSMIPGMPPVSSAGAPIPFPPPHVSFGFPPPPIRPGQGPGMPPGCSAPFPWLHKASAPAFANFTDSDVRFASVNALTVRPVPPLMGQQASLLHPSYGIRPPAEHLSVTGNAATPPMPNEITNKPAPGQKGKEGSSESQTGKPGMFGGQSSGDAESANRGRPNEKGFEQMGNLSPRSHEKDQDVPMDEDESSHELHGINPDFHRDDVGLMPRFPGPPDFHSARGPMKGPWMRGPPPGPMPPGSRFHGMPPFQQRGSGPGTSRGMHPRMEMEFFHHQGPPGSRMHMGGPHGHPSRVSGNNGMIHGPPPPMHQHGQEWFPNRREFFDEPHFEREGQDRRFRQMDDWGHGREPWDDRKERNEDENKWGASEQDWKRDDKSNNEPPTQVPDVSPTKVPGVHTTKAPDVTLENINREERSPEMEKEKDHGTKAKQRPPETLLKDNQNWAEDMFRLKFYARDKAKAPRFSVKSFNRKRKSEETFSQNQEENKVQPEKPQQDSAQITIRSIEINNSKPEHIVSEKSELEKGNQVKSLSGDSMGTRESTAESRSRRDRDRKRSRWGRTLSQEREFQQQRINEIEMKFQSYEFLHPVPTTDTIENGNTVAVKTDVENIINPLEACNDSIINQDDIVSTHNDLTSLEGTSSAISHTIAAVEDSSSAISHITAAVEDSSAVSLHVIAPNEDSSAVGLHDAIAPIEDSSDVGLQNAIAHIEDSSAVGLHNAVPVIEDSSAVGLHNAAPSIEDSSAVGLHNAIGSIEDSSTVGLHNDIASIEDSSNAGVHNAIAPIEDSTVDMQNAIDAMEDNCTVGTKNTSVTMEDSNSVDVHNINSSIEDSSNVGTHDTTVDIEESSSVGMHSNVAAIEDSVINEAKVSSIVEDHSSVQDMSAESSADTTDQEIPSKLAKSSDASVLPVSMES